MHYWVWAHLSPLGKFHIFVARRAHSFITSPLTHTHTHILTCRHKCTCTQMCVWKSNTEPLTFARTFVSARYKSYYAILLLFNLLQRLWQDSHSSTDSSNKTLSYLNLLNFRHYLRVSAHSTPRWCNEQMQAAPPLATSPIAYVCIWMSACVLKRFASSCSQSKFCIQLWPLQLPLLCDR